MGEQGNKEGIWAALRGQIAGNLPAIVGFSFCLIWVFVASHDLSISITIVSIQGLSARSILLLGTALGALFLLVFARKKIAPGPKEVGVAVGLMSVGFLLFGFPDAFDVPEPVSLAFVFLSGFGYGILFLAWVSRADAESPKRSLAFFGIAIFIASIIDAILIVLPLYLILVAMVCLPVLSTMLYIQAGHAAKATKASVVLGATSVQVKKTALAAVILPLVVEGFAYGAFTQLVFYLNTSLENVVGVYALTITAALLLLSAVLYAWLAKRKTLMFAFFVMLALGYSCIPLLSSDIRLIIFVLMLSYNFFYFLALALCGEFGKRIGASFLVCSSIAVLSFSGGDAVGSLFVGAVAEHVQPELFYIGMSNAVVYSFLIAAFVAVQFFFGSQGARRAIDDESDALLGAYAKDKGFSQRETDVFELLSRGRSAGVIADKLFISSETVRVHIKSIYKKADVHSQQELIDSFESYGAERRSR